MEFYDFMIENQENGAHPIEACGFCGRNLILGELDSDDAETNEPGKLKLVP